MNSCVQVFFLKWFDNIAEGFGRIDAPQSIFVSISCQINYRDLKARANFGHAEIRVFDHDWNVVEIIAAEITRGLV